MKKDIPKPLIFGIIAVAVILLAIGIFKTMSGPVGEQMDERERQQAFEGAMELEKQRASGQEGVGGEAAARGQSR